MNESARDALRTLVDVIADGIAAGEISDWYAGTVEAARAALDGESPDCTAPTQRIGAHKEETE